VPHRLRRTAVDPAGVGGKGLHAAASDPRQHLRSMALIATIATPIT
jgi:hypothetical protein